MHPAFLASQGLADEVRLRVGSSVEDLFEAYCQYRVRADLDEEAGAVGVGRVDRAVELHRFAEVLIPVLLVQGIGVDQSAHCRGIEVDVGTDAPNLRQSNQFVAQILHGP
ncbi:hypothetical protein NONI108955_44520 [Nocardia ninae]